MIPLSRALIRAALAWLVAGLALRALSPWLDGSVAQALEPVARHALVLGWITQLAIGVAWWMFPRPRGAPATVDAPLGWTCLVLLNTGLLLRAWAEPAAVLAPSRAASAGSAVAAVLLLVAVLLFAWSAWRRVGSR